jgi:hypothetical protein
MAVIGDFAQPVGKGRGSGKAPVVYSLLAAPNAGGEPRYQLRRGHQQLIESHDPSHLVAQLLWQISGDTVELATGHLLIHAGAIVAPAGGAVLVLGESGSGKTTLVAALVQEGFGYLSDEAAAIDLTTGLVQPWPRPLGFKQGARSLERFSTLFGSVAGESPTDDELHIGVGRIRPAAVAEACHVRHVLDHCYRSGAATSVEPLSRAEALVRMGSAAPRLRHEGDRGLGVLADVMRGASAYSLVSGDLDQAIGAVRELVRR